MTGNEIVPSEVEAEIAALAPEVANHRSGYWKGPGAEAKQARLRDLFRARDAGGQAPAKIDALTAERQAIERLMTDRSSAYFTGPKIDGETALAKRYLELLAGTGSGEHAQAGVDSWRGSLGSARAQLDPGLVASFGEQFPAALTRMQDTARNVVGALDRAAAALFEGSFSGLGTNIQSAILAEAGAPEPGFVTAANDADMALFRDAIPGADNIIAAWGRDARRRVGMVLDAAQRIDVRLSKAEKEQWKFFWDACPPREKMLMAWAIGSKGKA